LGLLSKKISWDVFYLRYLIDMQLYILAVAAITNTYQESSRYASSFIDCAFSSKMLFNHSVWPFCWCTCKVLVSCITSCSLRKDCNSDITYSLPLSVYNLFTGWEVVFDHIWKIDLTTSAASDFLYRKAMLQ